MLSGYLDDRSKHSWGEWKKGLLDLAICLTASITYLAFNGSHSLSLFGWTLVLPQWLFLLVATFVLWVSIKFYQLHRRRGRSARYGIDPFDGDLYGDLPAHGGFE